MNIYLIRHGQKKEDDKNHESIELTEKGLLEADILGRRMKQYEIKRIYSSNMVRAIQTAEGINKYISADILIRPELREINMGDCDNMGWEHMVRNYPEFIKEFEKHDSDISYPPNGECGQDVWGRVKKVIDEIKNEENLNNVAIVTHGGVIRVLICSLLGIEQYKRFYIGSLHNCSISRIKYDRQAKKFFICSINDYAHLEGMDFNEGRNL